jgi:transcriptional regulator with XRE-family HTH domain
MWLQETALASGATSTTHVQRADIRSMTTGAQRYGRLIVERRKHLKISREDLAKRVQVRAQTLMGWEKASTERFNLDEIRRVGDILQFGVEDYLSLFGITDSDIPPNRRMGFEDDPLLDDEDKGMLRRLHQKLRGEGRRRPA